MSLHWLTRYDPEDGEPYGQTCDCEIGVDHDGDGDPMFATVAGQATEA
ncbi:MAG: hypothetical protein JWO67_4018 [Streptosporangiaceae bacterium]|nr:hypothetical protein [Streptosporangiaceae bacterium]